MISDACTPTAQPPTRPYVGVPCPSLVYVGIVNRADFDRIASPATEHESADEHLLTKTVEQPGCTVIFQHWIKVKPL